MIPIVATLIDATSDAAERLRARVSNVRWDAVGVRDAVDRILFDFDGVPMVGVLTGRNRDALIGIDKEADRGIAVRVLLDGDATPVPRL